MIFFQGDIAWLRKKLPALETEYNFWMTLGKRAVEVEDDFGMTHVLNRYYSESKRARPESFVEDELTAWMLWQQKEAEKQEALTAADGREQMKEHAAAIHKLFERTSHILEEEEAAAAQSPPRAMHTMQAERTNFDASESEFDSLLSRIPPPPHPIHDNSTVVQALYSELTAAAETGWDFSSRWFRDRNNLTSVETSTLIPVDLNAILFAVEQQLSSFFGLVGDSRRALDYASFADARMLAIERILWNATASQWQDYNTEREVWKLETMISNFIPLWTKCYDKSVGDAGSTGRRTGDRGKGRYELSASWQNRNECLTLFLSLLLCALPCLQERGERGQCRVGSAAERTAPGGRHLHYAQQQHATVRHGQTNKHTIPN